MPRPRDGLQPPNYTWYRFPAGSTGAWGVGKNTQQFSLHLGIKGITGWTRQHTPPCMPPSLIDSDYGYIENTKELPLILPISSNAAFHH